MTTYTLTGILIRNTPGAITGVRVELYDADEIILSPIAVAPSATDGTFAITLTSDEAAAIFGGRPPRVFLRVFSGDRELLADTAGRITWQINRPPPLVRIPIGGPIGTVSGPAPLVVTGVIVDAESGPISGLFVQANDVTVGTEGNQTLGSGMTDARGRYRIEYNRSDIIEGKERPDIRVTANDLGDPPPVVHVTSDVYCQAPAFAVIDLVHGGEEYLGVPESTRVWDAIQPALGSANIAELTEQQIAQLACSARVSEEEVRAMVTAHEIVGAGPVDPVIVYGLLRTGQRGSRRDVIPRPASQHRRAVEQALEERIIPTMTTTEVDEAIDELVEDGIRLAVDEVRPRTTCNLGDVLKIALGETETDTKTREFVRRFYFHQGSVEEFWTNLTSSTFTSTDRERLQLALQWGTLTRWHLPLIEELEARRDAETATSLRDLAKYDESTWASIIDGLDPKFPDGIPGNNDTERAANYAKVLERTLEFYLPTPALAGRLLASNEEDPVGKFLDDPGNAGFDFGKQRVLQYLADSPTYPSGVTEQDVRGRLLQYERLVKITPRHTEMSLLLEHGLDSAQAIARMGRAQFVRKFGAPFGDIVAEGMHKQAEATKDAALAIWMKYGATANDLSGLVMPNMKETLPEGTDSLLAGYEQVFGAVSDCTCRHCRSVVSPAAYFVDLLSFLHRFDSSLTYDTDGVWTARDVLLGATDGSDEIVGRRPDLAHIALSCANADTPVVYVDLVNEIMERLIAEAALPAAPLETKASKEELLAAPEILDPAAHDLAYGIVAEAFYPWAVPFNQWALQTRTYLDHLGVARHAVMRALRHDFRMSDLRGCAVWLRADAVERSATNKITRWRDLAGNHQVAAAPAAADAELDTGANDQPCGMFAGTEALSVTHTEALDLEEVTIVAITSDQTSGEQWLVAKGTDATSFNYALRRTSSGAIAVGHGAGFVTGPAWATTGGNAVVTIATVAAGQDVEWRLDGSASTTAATPSLSPNASPLVIGAHPTGPSSLANFFEGRLYELAIFNRRLSEEEARRIEEYAFARYQAAPATLYPPAAQIAQEALGLSTTERRLVVGEPVGTPAGWQLWGFSSASPGGTDWFEHLLTAAHFVAATGASFDVLRELVDTAFLRRFVTPPTVPVLVPGAGADGCQLEEIELSGLDAPLATAWDGVQRFMRLAKRLDLSLTELDKLVTALSAELDDALLVHLAAVFQLRGRVARIAVGEISSWWGDIDTQPTPSRELKSLYEQLFLNKALEQPIVEAFEDPEALSGALSAFLPHVLASVRLSARDHALLTDHVEADARLDLPPAGPTDDVLSLANLSRLYRVASLSRAAGLRVADFVVLQALSGLAPLAGDASEHATSPEQTLAFLDHVARWRSRQIRTADLQYWLRGVEEPTEGISRALRQAISDAEVIEAAVASVEEATAPTGAADAERLSELLSEAIGSHDTALSPAEVAEKAAMVLAVVDGTSALDLLGQRDALELILGPVVDADGLTEIQDELMFRPYRQLESCQLWLEPRGLDAGIEDVAAWPNLALGSSATATQATEEARPRFNPHGPFGLPAATFDGAEEDPDHLVIDVTYGAQAHSFFFILRPAEQPDEEHVALLDIQTGRLVLATRADDSDSLGFFDGTSWTAQADAVVGEQILAWTVGGGVARLFRNGEPLAETSGAPSVGVGGAVHLGGNAALGLAPFAGDIAVAAIFSEALDGDTLRRVHDYLALLAGVPAARRYAVVESALLAQKRRRDAEAAIKSHVAAAIGVDQDVAAFLLVEALTGAGEVAPLLTDFMPDAAATADDRVRSMVKLRKVGTIVTALDIDLASLRWIVAMQPVVGWLDLDALPSELQPTFDASVARVQGGLFGLPGWLAIASGTGGRSTRLGASRVVTGLDGDTARAFTAGDDEGAGILVEPATTNLLADQVVGEWTGEAIARAYRAPDGSNAGVEVIDDSTSAEQTRATTLDPLSPGDYTLSAWAQIFEPGQTALLPRLSGNTGDPVLEVTEAEAAWRFVDTTSEVTLSGSATTVELVPRGDSPAGVGAARAWGLQLEARRYPTSFVGADGTTFTRDADVLSIPEPATVIRPDGHYSVTLRYAPLYATGEIDGEHDLVYLHDDHRLYYDATDRRIHLLSELASVASAELDFGRHQRLTVTAENLPSGLRLQVSDATEGNGTWTTGTPSPVTVLPAAIYLFGRDGGAQEGAVLTYVSFSTQALSTARELYAGLVRIVDFLALREVVRPAPDSLVELLERTVGPHPLPESAFLDALGQRTRWPREDLGLLASTFGIPYPEGYWAEEGLTRLREAFLHLSRLGVSAKDALAWLDVDEPAAPGRATAAEALRAAKNKHDDALWPEVGRPLRDPMREAQRQALSAYLVHTTPGVSSTAQLYERLLVDVDMSPCQLTSRLVQANASIQLFVQRILLNVEDDVSPDPQMAREWKWMKNYRVWQANREVFLWPENWIEPELRDDKSPLFEKLESELLQTEITDGSAESAYKKYLQGLAEISRLDIFAMTRGIAYFGLPPKGAPLYVFGRTLTEQGRRYYHRTMLGNGRWTPWHTMELDVKSDHAIPFLRNGRLHLAWLEIEQRPGEVPASSLSDNPDDPAVNLELRLAITKEVEGGWSPPTVTGSFSLAASFDYEGHSKNYDGNPFARERRGFHLVLEHAARPTIFVQYFHRDTYNSWGAKVRWEQYYPFPGFYVGDVGHTATIESPKSHTKFRDTVGRPYYMDMGARSASSPLSLVIKVDKTHQQVPVLQNRPSVWRAVTDHYRGGGTTPYADPATELFYKDEQHTFYGAVGEYPNLGLSLGTWTNLTEAQPLNTVLESTALEALGPEVLDWATESKATSLGIFKLPETERVRFRLHQHPLVNDALAALSKKGVTGLLEWKEPQPLQMKEQSFFSAYAPHPEYVHGNHPVKDFDFDFDGAYSTYNWELFFHIPFMVAIRLAKEQRYEEARRWFHAIFDPTDGSTDEGTERFWKVKPFYLNKSIKTIQEEMVTLATAQSKELKALLGGGGDLTGLMKQIDAWRDDPFNPHLIARMRPLAYQKATVMRYLDNLIEWGDHLFRRFTMESVAEATQLYLLAKGLLGPKPVFVERTLEAPVVTFNDIKNQLDPFSNYAENLIPPNTQPTEKTEGAPPTPVLVLGFCIPPNEKLLRYWDLVEDRLFKIRHCMDIEGVARELPIFEPPIDPALLVQAAAAGVDLSSVLDDLRAPPPIYRLQVLLQRALDFAQGVIALGASLLAAIEKRDGEELSLIRQRQEILMLDLVRETRKRQVEEAEESLASMRAQREITQRRFEFYRDIEFMTATEISALATGIGAGVVQAISQGIQLGAGVTYAIPTFTTGISGMGGTPVLTTTTGGGSLGNTVEAAAAALGMVATILREAASVQATHASYERRWDEWKLQEELAERELKQIDKQIAAAALRVEIAKRELLAHEQQLADAKRVEDFLKRKFTNRELYSWMDGQLRQTYFRTYQLAYALARQAERAYQFERGDLKAKFVHFGYWDGRKAGLLAGEKLLADLRVMESEFLQRNRREYELTKHVSLAQHFPAQLVALRELGSTVISLSEGLFDRDYPGHYMRRIKSVSMTLAAVSGPYDGVHCRLTLLNSRIRADSLVGADGYAYEDLEDPRFIHDFGVRGSVCTSSAQDDAGLFQLNFQDERYLPFEGAGAVSQWRLEIDPDTNRFDLSSITDIILHVSYMAREGGEPLRAAAKAVALGSAPRTATRLFSLRHEFALSWSAFENELDEVEPEPPLEDPTYDQVLRLDMKDMLPFLHGRGAIRASSCRLAAKWADEAVDLSVAVTPAGQGAAAVAITAKPVPLLATPAAWDDASLAEGLWELRITSATLNALPAALTEVYGLGKRIKPALLRDLFLVLELERDPPAK